MFKETAIGIGVALGAIFVVCLPFALWMGVMMLLAWLVHWLYHLTCVPIFGWTEIAYWPMFGLIWLIAIIGNLIRR